MAHNLTLDKYFAYNSNHGTTWHGLGQAFTDNMSPLALCIAGNFNIQYMKAPLSALDESGKPIDLAFESCDADATTPLFMVVRKPIEGDSAFRPVGVVSDSYTLISNEMLAYLMEPLWGQPGVEMSTMGLLGHSAHTFFFALKTPSLEIGGVDTIDPYIMVRNGHNGLKGVSIIQSAVRPVCQNTVALAEERATIHISLNHTNPHIIESLQVIPEMLAGIIGRREELQKECSLMAAYRIKDDELDKILDAAFPSTVRKTTFDILQSDPITLNALVEKFGAETTGSALGKGLSVNRNNRANVASKYAAMARTEYERFNDEFPQMAGTAWAGLQAVTYVNTHKSLRGDPSPVSVQFGTRAMSSAKAYEVSLAISR